MHRAQKTEAASFLCTFQVGQRPRKAQAAQVSLCSGTHLFTSIPAAAKHRAAAPAQRAAAHDVNYVHTVMYYPYFGPLHCSYAV